jgi:serine/threonine protein kinase
MTQPRLLGGRYELDGVVGRGGMAEVYRARDIRLDRIVAIKTLRADLARDQIFQARFRREAQSAASLNHPSIVAVYDTGEDMATGVPVPYIVMEYVDGRTVRDLLQEGHRLLPERSLEIIDGVLRALDYSHQAGIVHRDIKPGNVMVTRNGDIKVMDFGIARAMSDAQATMTQTAQVIGTAQYLSPEQARGERVDARSDLYSAGCLLYELLTGRPPFTGDSPVAIAYQHVRENPVPPSRVDPDVPAWADAIVLKAMAKSPADRYQTAADMRADLQRAASGMPVSAPPTRLDNYPRTQRMGTGAMMAGTTQIPAVEDYDYAGGRYDRGGRGGGGSRRWIPWVLGLVIVLGVVGGVAYYLLAGGGQTYAVPLVNGLSVTAAQNQIKANHLRSTVVDQANATVRKTTSSAPIRRRVTTSRPTRW